MNNCLRYVSDTVGTDQQRSTQVELLNWSR